MTDVLQQLVDKEAIRECLARYARGIDRHDRAVLETVYWPDAVDNHLTFSGAVSDFIDFAFGYSRQMRTHHLLGQTLIAFASDTEARTETYYVAAHERPTPTDPEELLIRGRYLDRFEKRGDEWRIIERTLTCDLYGVASATSDWRTGPYAAFGDTEGQRWPRDALYQADRGAS